MKTLPFYTQLYKILKKKKNPKLQWEAKLAENALLSANMPTALQMRNLQPGLRACRSFIRDKTKILSLCTPVRGGSHRLRNAPQKQ